MKVKNKDLLWSSLPNAKDKKKIMADKGKRIPGLKSTLNNLPQDYFDVVDPQPSMPKRTPLYTPADTSKIKLPSIPGATPPTQNNSMGINWGNALLYGLSAFDALIPNPVPKMQVVDPQLGYNPYPYGTGSQALRNGGYVPGEDENNSPGARSGIHIKPSKRGTLHDALGIPRDKKIPASRLKDNPGDSPALKKKKLFARNARKWKHGQGGFIQPGYDEYKRGGVIPDPMSAFNPHKYEYGGHVKEVGPYYPNTDLLEQYICYEDGGEVREVGSYYPNTDLLEQFIQYCRDGGQLSGSKAKEMLRDGKANGKKLTEKQKRFFGWVAGGRKAEDGFAEPDPREQYYRDSARLSHYKNILNEQLKSKDPQAYSDYFKGLSELRRSGKTQDAQKYIQESPYNVYLTPSEVRNTLGENDYNDYLSALKSVNSYDTQQGRQPLYGQVEGNGDLANLNYGRRFASLQITPSLSVYNQSRGTNYSRNYTYDPQKRSVNYSESGDLSLRPSYVAMKNGGIMYDDGGDVSTMWGGDVELSSYNPYDGGTLEFNGASHENGGIGMQYNGSPVEVEGGEYAARDNSGNLNVFGNMYLPGTKTKFKSVAKAIADKERNYDSLKTIGANLVNNSDIADPYERLSFNSGKVMMQGGKMGQVDISQKKQNLASLQKAMLDTAAQFDLDPQSMSKGKIKKAKGGTLIPFFQNGGDTDPTMADRNNNPGNIKWGKFARKYGAKKGPSAPDGGFYAVFPSRQKGFDAMRGLLNSGSYKDLTVSEAISKWTGGSPYEYTISTRNKRIGDLNAGEMDQLMTTMTRGEGTRYGAQPSSPQSPVRPSTPTVTAPPPTFTTFTLPPVTLTPDGQPATPAPGTVTPPYDRLNPPPDNPPIPSNVEPLHLNQVLGEIYAAATNKVEPVPTQRYEPELFVPYQMSLQDRLNLNQNTFSALQRSIGATNPSALGALAAQKYEADNAIKAEEFRINQAISNDIRNKNIALINDATLKNLAIADTQMVRQSTARSKTRQFNQMIVNSLADKYAQNDLENKRLAVYENLYDYRYVPQEDGGLKATYMGPNAVFNYEGTGTTGNRGNISRTISRYDAQGNLKGYAEYEDSDLREMQRMLDVEMKKRKLPLMQVPPLQ